MNENRPLMLCPRHPGQSHREGDPCYACEAERLLDASLRVRKDLVRIERLLKEALHTGGEYGDDTRG